MKKTALALVLACLPFWSAIAGVTPLPDLSKTVAWGDPDSGTLHLAERSAWLEVRLDLPVQSTTRILLNKPIPLPSATELVWNGTCDSASGFILSVIVKDAKNREFRFHQESRSFSKDSFYLGAFFDKSGMHRLGEVLFRTEGLQDLRTRAYTPLSTPTPPLTILGLEFANKREKPIKNTLYFRDFRLSNMTHHNSTLYYQFNSLECFGELSGPAALSWGELLDWDGTKFDHFIADWTLRDVYDGQPRLTGSAQLQLDPGEPKALQLAKTLSFPVRAKGTYWITVKYRAYGKDSVLSCGQKEYRLYIIRGDETPLPSPLNANLPLGQSTIRIAPDRQSYVYRSDEPYRLMVAFFSAQGTTCRVQVLDKSGTVLAEQSADATTDTESLHLDLSALKEGIHTVIAEQRRGDKLLDHCEQAIARQEHFSVGALQSPPGVANADDLICGQRPQFYLDVHFSNRGNDEVKKVNAIMSATDKVANVFELRLAWDNVERFRGAYDFSDVDAEMEHARKIGVKVQLHISLAPPQWIPSHFTQNPEGKIFGHTSYLFNGSRANLYHSPDIRAAALKFMRAIVLHYRNHPALQSYYLLIEHPNEAPYTGWYDGYDEFTIAGFRTAMHAKYSSIAALNAAWKTTFTDFSTLVPPLPQATATNCCWRDWIAFKEDAVRNFQVQCVDLIRASDPQRMIMMYSAISEKMRNRGVMTANGGCHNTTTHALWITRLSDLGLYQRSEEHSVTNWVKYFPTQLDTSLFTMMLGGGFNSSCKMFFPESVFAKRQSLADVRVSGHGLERFEKFQPIWTELRNGDQIYRDVRFYYNEDSSNVFFKTTYTGGDDTTLAKWFLDAQVPYWVAPGKDWQQAKLIVLPRARLMTLETNCVEELSEYVRNGGNLLMCAESGRYSMEDDGTDWMLLRKFGFPIPTSAQPLRGSFRLYGAPDTPYNPGTPLGMARELWENAEPAANAVALNAPGKDGKIAVSRRDYGRGSVYVLWTPSLLPPGDQNPTDLPILRVIAKACGAQLPAESDSRLFWVNVLKHREKEVWYLLIMRSNREGKKDSAIRLMVANGSYRVRELINNTGGERTVSGAELSTKGLPVVLNQNEVAIYRVERN